MDEVEPATQEELDRLAAWHEACGHNLPPDERIAMLTEGLDAAPRNRRRPSPAG